jgi:hypothetical protein
LGTILARTGVIGPHGRIAFQTDIMPPTAGSYSLKEIKGIM